MSNILTLIGVFISAVYSFVVYKIVGERLHNLETMPLNEVGDFLAGVFGPLAILWLVLGFLQQGKELRQNTEALELQAEELANSVRQQEELVEVSWRQHESSVEALEEEKERVKKLSEPNFSLLGFVGARSSIKYYKLSCIFLNSGATALHVEAFINAEIIGPSKNKISLWPKQENNRVEFTLALNNLPETIELKIKYSNELDEHFEKVFTANKDLNDRYNVVYQV